MARVKLQSFPFQFGQRWHEHTKGSHGLSKPSEVVTFYPRDTEPQNGSHHDMTSSQHISEEELRTIVNEAREKLTKLVNVLNKGNPALAWKVMGDLGGREGMFSLLRIVQLDQNGDGHIGAAEVAQFEELGKQLVDQYLGYFGSEGVVTALVFSTMFPIAASTSLDMEFIYAETEAPSYDVKTALSIVAYVSLMLSVSMSICHLIYMSGMYLIMSFWLPTVRAQLFFVDVIQGWGRMLSICKNTCFIAAALYLLFSSLSTSGWVGFAALMPVLGALVPVAHLWAYVGTQLVTPYLFNYTRELLKMPAAKSEQEQKGGRSATVPISAQ